MTSLNVLVPRREFRFPPVDAPWDLLDVDGVQNFLANLEAIVDGEDSLALYMTEQPLRASRVEAQLQKSFGNQGPRVIENRNADDQSGVSLTWTRVVIETHREQFRQADDVYHVDIDGMVVEVPPMVYHLLDVLQEGIGKKLAKEIAQQEKKAIRIVSQKMDGMIQCLTEAVDRMTRLQGKLKERQETIDIIGLDEAGRSLHPTQETLRIDHGTDGQQGGTGIEDTRDDGYITVEGSDGAGESSSSSDVDMVDDGESSSSPDADSEKSSEAESMNVDMVDGGESSSSDTDSETSPKVESMDDDMEDEPVGRAGSDEGHSITTPATTSDGSATQLSDNNTAAGVNLAPPPGGTSNDIQLASQGRELSDIPLSSHANNIPLSDDERRHGFYFIESLRQKRVKWDDIVIQYAFRFNVHRRRKNLGQRWQRWRDEGMRLGG